MKRFLLTLAFCLPILAWPAQAQDRPTLSTLDISLWPEFDRPEVLVIYRGLFSEDTPLPVPVEFRIPAGAGQPNAVAYVGDGGQRFNQEYDVRQEGDWLLVSFELAAFGFQLEYYDDLLTDAEGNREYAYRYLADYAVAALSMDFQVPPTAEGFVLEPAADSVAQETDGLTYHFVQAGPLAEGEQRTWTFSYQKDNSDLTASAFVQPEASVPAAPPAATQGDNSIVWIFLVAFVALVAVGAGAFWLGRRASLVDEAALPPAKRHKRRGSGRGANALPQQRTPSVHGETPFCYKCGTQLRSDSEFCHKCGAKVRRE